MLEKLLDKNLNKRLLSAAEDGDLDKVKAMMESGADANAKGKWGAVPLHFAVSNHYLEMVEYLLDAGADVNAVNERNRTSLHMAAMLNYHDIAQCLMAHGADHLIESADGKTAMDFANETLNIELAEFISEYKFRKDENEKLESKIVVDDKGIDLLDF